MVDLKVKRVYNLYMFLPFDDNYECSVDGIVRNRKTLKVLKGNVHQSGYLYYDLHLSGKRLRANRLVGLIFLPLPTQSIESLQVDHIDGNKLNNSANNLRWLSSKENNNNRRNPVAIVASKSNKLGELYICFDKGSYRLKITGLGHCSWHKNLDSAIETRQQLLAGQS